jgi:outer membrane protein assembly factor BamC
MKHVFNAALIAFLAAVLATGCSTGGTKSTDYRSSSTRPSTQPLEIPPELTAPSVDDRFTVPDPKAQTTFSTYNTQRASGPVVPAGTGVLPAVDGARMERGGTQRWLVVKTTPDKAWPVVREFWTELGFSIQRESPEVGILETDWAEDRAKIQQDLLRRTLGRIVEGMWSTGHRDKFRTRLEKGVEPNTTEIYVSHRGVEEVYTNAQNEKTIWQPRPSDPELEAEMLAKIQNKFGYDPKQAATAAGLTSPTVKPAAGSAAAAPATAQAVLQNNGSGPLVVNDGFDRAWRRVGLALDRVGFTVEDRDRSKGVFFVRYIDPDVDLKAGEKQGFLDKLAFWKASPKAVQPQFRIHVVDSGGNLSQVEVQNSAGAAENTSTGKKILALLFEQLK